MKRIYELDIHGLISRDLPCSCGRVHRTEAPRVLEIGAGVSHKLPAALESLGVKKPFVVMGDNSKRVLGDELLAHLDAAGQQYEAVCLSAPGRILPDEHYLGRLEEALPPDCDFILGIGSGVINDLCKMLAHARGLDCGIAATAPSMDGYASNSSAMELGGVKTTVYTKCPALILCDTEIMRHAPMEMLSAGFGDMAAKLISIADWHIAHLVTGEYYCGELAQLMLRAYEKALQSAEGLLRRSGQAVEQLTEGLILSGLASSLAGVSRPASGMEHTLSHLLEMFALAKGRQPDLHGTQVGYGVRAALRLYKRALDFEPTMDKCLARLESFDEAAWAKSMEAVFGAQAGELISKARREGRYSPENTLRRCRNALENAGEIKTLIANVCREAQRLEAALDMMGLPALSEPERMGFSLREAENALRFSPHLRDRYIFTSYCMDMGIKY